MSLLGPTNFFPRVCSGPGPARSEELDAWLVVRHEGDAAGVGLAREAGGRGLVPSVDQSRQQERIARKQAEWLQKQERIARKQAEWAKEQERIAREQAEQLLAEALAELTQLKQGG